MPRLVVIGGGAAGMSAASAARRVAPDLDVVVFEAGGYAAYGMCGIPYYLAGVVQEAESLLAYPPEEFTGRRGIDLRLRTRVTAIDPDKRRLQVSGDGRDDVLDYDALVVAAGADPVRPPVPGLDHDRVFTVRSLDEAIELRRLLDSGAVRRAVVVGAGYIGLETAEALFGLEVARTGLSLADAGAAGLAAVATDVTSRSRAKYYPGGSPLHVRLVHEPGGRLLGAQLAGREGAAKRIDVLATALQAGFSIADLAALDLGYAPPYAPVYDPVLLAAQKAGRKAATAGGTR